MLTRRFLSELPKLIISSGLAEQCQEQELLPRPRPGQARPGSPCYHCCPPLPSAPSTQSLRPSSWGRIGGAACLYWLSGPGPESGTLPRGLFACSGVLIKSFIVFHSRKELRRNTEQNGAERREKKRKEERGRGGRRVAGGKQDRSLFFSFPLLLLSSFFFFLWG